MKRHALGFVCSVAVALAAGPVPAFASGEATRVGDVDTTFRVVGRNDKIVVDRYDDPRVDGVSCYLSRAESGGLSATVGLATDPSRFSVACRAVGPVTVKRPLPANEEVFAASANWFSKEIRVTRIYDKDKQVAIYLVWSTKVLSTGGSPYNSITAVPLRAEALPGR